MAQENAGEYITSIANDIDRQLVSDLSSQINSKLGLKDQGYNIIKTQTQVVNGINRKYDLLSSEGRLPAQITIYTPFGQAKAQRLLGEDIEIERLGAYKPKVVSGDDYQRVQDNSSVLKEQAQSKNTSYVISHARTQVVNGTNYAYNLRGVQHNDFFRLEVYVPLSKVTTIKQ